jgi:hypothetical protein
MSRAKERRVRPERSPVARARPVAGESASGEAPRTQDPRIQEAWRRAWIAKRALAAVGVIVFGCAMVLARLTFAGHPKQVVRPLSAPPKFVDTVRQNLLQAGLAAPAKAPPGAATGVS